MTKDDLKIGYGVELRNGTKGIIVPYHNNLVGICFFDGGGVRLNNYTSNLKSIYNTNPEYDIIKVYNVSYYCLKAMSEDFENHRELLWEEFNSVQPLTDTAENILMYGMEINEDD